MPTRFSDRSPTTFRVRDCTKRSKNSCTTSKDDGVEDVRILVVWGLGGAGKSQLVLNYIREYRRDYIAVFWIEAGSTGPGCGKSVLSRSLIDDRRVCTSAMTSTVCYFFFKDGQEQRMRGANALSAMLHQLFENTALVGHALPSAKSYGKKLRDAFGELWGILTKCAQDSEAGEIICIIDALEECEKDSRSQLLEKLMSFFSHI